MPRRFSTNACLSLLLASAPASLAGEGALLDFEGSIRPVLTQYCLGCHSTEKQKGDLDLEPIASLEGLRRHPKIWQKVWSQLSESEMPPKEKPQPSPDEKSRLMAWVRGSLDTLALERAGDPGPVVLRRLSNAEYTWSVRELTGLDTLDPAREFPVDGAAGEGFSNTGQALVMSPSLVTKYLDAAKGIASHAVLLPDGIRFSNSTTRRDWTEEILTRIRAFYSRYTTAGGAGSVTQQGIALDLNKGGALPLEGYLKASLDWRDGEKNVEALAAQRGLSPKYLASLVDLLDHGQPSLLLDGLRAQWRRATPADVPALTAGIGVWQQALWKFSSVGHIGKIGGPKAWMEPVSPLVTRQELRLKLPEAGPDGKITVYFLTGDAGDGGQSDRVIWQEPQLIRSGQPPQPLHDLVPLPGWTGVPTPAPNVIELQLPATAAGAELVTTATLDPAGSGEGSVQLQLLTTKAEPTSGLQPGATQVGLANGLWSSNNQTISFQQPILVREGSPAQSRFETAFSDFRGMFPASLCYTKIVPVDEVVTLTLFYREDGPLVKLLLDDAATAELERLWAELRFVSQDALTLVDAFEQLWQFATQDADPKAFEPLRQPINERAAAFRQQLRDTEPRHLEAVLDFADRAFRRPLTDSNKTGLREFYQKLRREELPHEEAIRLMLARVLVSPSYLYKGEQTAPGMDAAPVNAAELATRLSYFLWSSPPDAALRAAADGGHLQEPAELAAQTRRMLADPRIRRMATEFACSWLHIRDFDSLDEKSERLFPEFAGLRAHMYEESIQFLTDLFQQNRPVLNLLNADYAFLDESMAKHYGIPGVSGPEWRRVDGVRTWSRGGILTMATTLAKQSGASRTSPILRGNWVAEVLLGDRLPRPPKDVPRLPEDASSSTLTMRQLTEKHSSDPRCAGCHVRIDAFGFALESFDTIGRLRTQDPGGRPIDTHATTMDGTALDGPAGLRDYLLTNRRGAFLQQFCRKLFGYALGRSVQLSDEPLLKDLQTALAADNYHVQTAIQLIVQSRQFREIRGQSAAFEE